MFQAWPQVHDHRSCLPGDHPHSGHRMRGPEGPCLASSPTPVPISGSTTVDDRSAASEILLINKYYDLRNNAAINRGGISAGECRPGERDEAIDYFETGRSPPISIRRLPEKSIANPCASAAGRSLTSCWTPPRRCCLNRGPMRSACTRSRNAPVRRPHRHTIFSRQECRVPRASGAVSRGFPRAARAARQPRSAHELAGS